MKFRVEAGIGSSGFVRGSIFHTGIPCGTIFFPARSIYDFAPLYSARNGPQARLLRGPYLPSPSMTGYNPKALSFSRINTYANELLRHLALIIMEALWQSL